MGDFVYYADKQICNVKTVVARYNVRDHTRFWNETMPLLKERYTNMASVAGDDDNHRFLVFNNISRGIMLHRGNSSLVKLCRFKHPCQIVRSRDLPYEVFDCLDERGVDGMLLAPGSTWTVDFVKRQRHYTT